MKFTRHFLLALMLASTICAPLISEEESPKEENYTINFHDVPVVEFIQFVRKISGVNFIFNHRDLKFNVSLSSGKPVSADHVVRALVQILRAHGLSTSEEEGYLVIHKGGEERAAAGGQEPSLGTFASLSETKPQFLVYKLQYHDGSEIEQTIKRIADDLSLKPDTSSRYLGVLKSVQWIKSTNSLVCSGDDASLAGVKELLKTLDVPLRQVFIEILVVETDAKNSSEFGLQWAAGGRMKEGLGFGMGNFPPSQNPGPFALTFKGIDAAHPPTGASQFPLGNGFDMGVIGDIILHKGKSFLTLGSLVSALQADGESSIVLNQKIITQDNKNSTIFVGDNIPFTGSVVQTTGASQQTTANVEYRDIGVNLSITPKLGEGDVITLDLNEEITEALPSGAGVSSSHVSGIQTTKTNMRTHVHVPNKHFLVLSGMIRNAKGRQKVGLPCLGGIPFVGALFSKTMRHDEKRNVIIFVRPYIIKSMDDYRQLTERQEDLYRRLSVDGVMDEAKGLVEGG